MSYKESQNSAVGYNGQIPRRMSHENALNSYLKTLESLPRGLFAKNQFGGPREEGGESRFPGRGTEPGCMLALVFVQTWNSFYRRSQNRADDAGRFVGFVFGAGEQRDWSIFGGDVPRKNIGALAAFGR